MFFLTYLLCKRIKKWEIRGVSQVPFTMMEGNDNKRLIRFLRNVILLYMMRLEGDVGKKYQLISVTIKRK